VRLDAPAKILFNNQAGWEYKPNFLVFRSLGSSDGYGPDFSRRKPARESRLIVHLSVRVKVTWAARDAGDARNPVCDICSLDDNTAFRFICAV
jgi:hypothetical protein